MNIDKDIEILKEFKEKGFASLMIKYNKDRIQTNTMVETAIENVLSKLKKMQLRALSYQHLYEKLLEDFENYKNDKDINYLDGIHHKKLVEKSIGQIIDDPKECWFDVIEVKIIKDNKLYGITTNEDFINLKQIADTDIESCITVIAESPLSGAIYRYNNYGNKEWQLIGTMLGYA